MRASTRLLAAGAALALALTGCGGSTGSGSESSLVALDDPKEMTPPENVVPVVTQSALEANPAIEETLNEVSANLTTEGLAALNGEAAEGQQPADIAAGWLEENGLLDGEGGDASGDPVTVGGFNFPESTILMEIYAQALEDEGIATQREPELGTRELVFPELTGGNIDILPEYVGSAISVGFGEEPAGNTDEAIQQLRDLFAEEGVAVLEPAEAQDRNVFVVTSEFSEEHGVTSIADLADAGDLTLAGGPECEERATCYAGLQDVYGLDNIEFTTIQEKSPRLAALRNGDVQIILLFSTDPVFGE